MNRNYPIPLPTLTCVDVKGKLEVSVSGKVVKVVDLKEPLATAIPEVVRAIQFELEEVAKKGASNFKQHPSERFPHRK